MRSRPMSPDKAVFYDDAGNTFVVATAEIEEQMPSRTSIMPAGQVLWWVCVLLWAACTYTIFALRTVRTEKPDLAAGINGYCLACFGASQSVTAGSLEEAGWFVTPALGVLGLGTLLWMVGSFLFLSGALDSDPEGPDLHF